jgi:hypothetical protein
LGQRLISDGDRHSVRLFAAVAARVTTHHS